LFVYTHFTSGAGDNASAYLAGCYSSDGGKTWTEDDVLILQNEGGMNIMSVSLLRLQSGEVALFYLRKNSETDCIPFMRISTDEAKTWSEPKRCMGAEGYHTVNNDRFVQLPNGRIIFPTAVNEASNWSNEKIMCYYSDDNGDTWLQSEQVANPENILLQEPGIIELKEGKLMLFCRTNKGVQYFSFSDDNGETWSPIEPGNIKSPLSPASIERIPSTGDLLLLWNNNFKPEGDGGKRTPFNLAISEDEGKTWKKIKPVESDPAGWYCYTAIEFIDNYVLLGHCAGDTKTNDGLSATQVTRLSLDWIYGDATEAPIIKYDSSGIVELICPDKNAKIYYSLERKTPNILYDSLITVTRITPLWVQAIADGKSKSALLTTYVGTNIFQPSLDVTSSSGQGLTYNYYEGIVSTVKNIESLTVKSSGIIGIFNINNRERDSNFAFVFNGFIKIPEDGEYIFYLASNDGSVLYIDDNELVDHDGAHAVTEESAAITLRKGKHKISLKYFQMMGGQGLKLSWQRPGFEKTEIPARVLFHAEKNN
ncbi:MAG: hypothetical protein GQ525_06925, partial [Draconibacterium sp.]|nr:hypothetical protein [Draconibacterium sp.]